jgi:CBS domain-containing protein
MNTKETQTGAAGGPEPFQLLFFSNLLDRRIRLEGTNQKNGRLTDLVFRLSEPYPELVGIYIEHGRGLPSELVPWDQVTRFTDEAIYITPTKTGEPYPKFEDQPGWILVNEHLMGQTILDTDGRRPEVVNDVHLLYSKGRMILVHVDISFNGFLRKWHLARFTGKDQFISWRYVQPLSVEDHTKDIVTLSVAREQALELPSEDLADALEVLSGDEQQAMFAALAAEKAAEVLVEAEPRAKRQLILFLHGERARTVLDKLSVPQVADLFSELPHENVTELMKWLPPERAARIHAVMTDVDVPAATLMSHRFLAYSRTTTVGEVLGQLRSVPHDRRNISYLYILADVPQILLGLVDLRDLVTASTEAKLGDLMIAPVVTADPGDLREDLVKLFAKYQFRMLPVVDAQEHLLGVVRYKDLMKNVKIEYQK